ncbi:MAG: tripartite tricarboxylate transporter TctB family protein [Proteobacteria bacterium]|nr:tripartite tricarboxylate transporter TctB family protein [Pseudomonadota bacterium]
MPPAPRTGALLWALIWLLGAALTYFVLIPAGIEEPSYATQSPGAFPKAIAALIGLLALALFAVEWLRLQPRLDRRVGARFLVTPAIAGLYGLLLVPAGFIVASALSLAAMLFVFGERRPLFGAAIAVVTAVATYAVFVRLLGVPLPAGVLG